MSQTITANLLAALVAGYLAKHCRGLERARPQARIAGDLRALGLDLSTRDVRDAIAELRLAGAPVGTSSGGGCFLCLCGRDFRVAYSNLYRRLRTQAKGCRAFKKTARRSLSGQVMFDFAEGQNLICELEAAPLLAAASGQGPFAGACRGPGLDAR